MPIFLATPLTTNTSQLDQAVTSFISPTDYHKLQGGHGWLIKFEGTSVELSNRLTITTPESKGLIGSAMVTLVSSYFGRGPTEMWEWMKTRWDQ